MFNFRSIDDLLPIFGTVGEDGWEAKTGCILEAQAEEWGADLTSPVSEERLHAAEKRLGVVIPHGLRLFLRTFGVADIGEELQAPENMIYLDEWTQNLGVEEFLEPEEMALLPELVTFSEHLGIGNAFCFHRSDGSVYFFDHDTGPHLAPLFASVDDYLRACLINVQDIFFAPTVEDAESLIEERLVQLFGEKTVVKWLY